MNDASTISNFLTMARPSGQGYRTKNCWTLCQGFDNEGWVNPF